MDPFCDKVLVLGAFIYLSGPRFVTAQAGDNGELFTMVTGCLSVDGGGHARPRVARVTGIRGELEGAGVEFWGQPIR